MSTTFARFRRGEQGREPCWLSEENRRALVGDRPGDEPEVSGIDRWLRRNGAIVVLGVSAVGLAIRIVAAHGAYLSGDEATHFEIANVPTSDLYRTTLTEAHPPLFFLVLHVWRLLGNSELALRLLPTLFGVLF